MVSPAPFDPRVLAVLREVRLRVLVTALHLSERRRALVEEEGWRDLFGYEDEVAVAAAVLARPDPLNRALSRLRRSKQTEPLVPQIEALAPSPERWSRDLVILRAARCFHHVRRATEALLRRQQRAFEAWDPHNPSDTAFVVAQLLEDASLLPAHVAAAARELHAPDVDPGVDAAAVSIAGLHRVHGDWAMTLSVIENTAARARWTASLGEASYYGSTGEALRFSMLANAVLRELGHPKVTEHPAIIRLVDVAAEWTADACWRNTGVAYASSMELRHHTAAELRAQLS